MPSTPAGSSSGAGELIPRYEDVQNLSTTRDELQRAAREEIACPSCRAQVASLLRGASGSLAEMQATEIASRTVIHAIYERILGDKPTQVLLVQRKDGAVTLCDELRQSPERAAKLLRHFRPQEDSKMSSRGGGAKRGGRRGEQRCVYHSTKVSKGVAGAAAGSVGSVGPGSEAGALTTTTSGGGQNGAGGDETKLEWQDVWDALTPASRGMTCIFDVGDLSAAFDAHLDKMRFCPDCQLNVEDAFDILVGVMEPPPPPPKAAAAAAALAVTGEASAAAAEGAGAGAGAHGALVKASEPPQPPGAMGPGEDPLAAVAADGEYCAELFQCFTVMVQGAQHRLQCVASQMPTLIDAYRQWVMKEELARLEEGEPPTRHAPTLEQGQSEVLLFLGEYAEKQVRKIHRCQLVDQQVHDLFLRLVLGTLSTKLELLMHDKHMAADLEGLIDELEGTGKKTEAGQSKKAKKRKKQKERKKAEAAAAAAAAAAEAAAAAAQGEAEPSPGSPQQKPLRASPKGSPAGGSPGSASPGQPSPSSFELDSQNVAWKEDDEEAFMRSLGWNSGVKPKSDNISPGLGFTGGLGDLAAALEAADDGAPEDDDGDEGLGLTAEEIAAQKDVLEQARRQRQQLRSRLKDSFASWSQGEEGLSTRAQVASAAPAAQPQQASGTPPRRKRTARARGTTSHHVGHR